MSKLNIWKSHLESQKKSGLTQTEYCRQHNLHPVTFSYWKRRIKEVAGKSSGFVAVKIPNKINRPESRTQDSFQIDFTNGMKITFSLHAAPKQIAAIILALRKE
jgi:hypothetical protein